LTEADNVIGYREFSSKEASTAVLFGHYLILIMLTTQDDFFKLGLKSEIDKRYENFSAVWGNDAPGANPFRSKG
jgi:hypothetical protein